MEKKMKIWRNLFRRHFNRFVMKIKRKLYKNLSNSSGLLLDSPFVESWLATVLSPKLYFEKKILNKIQKAFFDLPPCQEEMRLEIEFESTLDWFLNQLGTENSTVGLFGNLSSFDKCLKLRKTVQKCQLQRCRHGHSVTIWHWNRFATHLFRSQI